MPIYHVKWTIGMEVLVDAENKKEARGLIENIDLVHDGQYIGGSFRIKEIKETKSIIKEVRNDNFKKR